MLLYYFFVWIQNECICHNVDTHNVKIVWRDRPHILASDRCEAFENLLHDDIAPVKTTLSGILHSKNLTMIFISINICIASMWRTKIQLVSIYVQRRTSV